MAGGEGGDGPAVETASQRLRVIVVAEGRPALGGIATFTEMLTRDPVLSQEFDIKLINTARRAVRRGGAASVSNAVHALVDAWRAFRAAGQAHVVHVQTALLPTLPLLRAVVICRAALAGGAAVLCHVHTGQANEGPHERFAPGRVDRWLLARLRPLRAILVVSEAGRRGLEPHVPGGRIEVVDNAVELDSFPSSDPGKEPVTVLYVGALARAKGLLDLLEATRAVLAEGPAEWKLEVVGGPNQRGETEAGHVRTAFRAAGCGAALLGPMPEDQVKAHFGSAGIFVLPSHSEGQPLSVMEAMGAGLPVIATRVGGITEMIRDEREGILVDPGRPKELADAMLRLIRQPELRRKLGAAGRRRAEERFGLDAFRVRMAELYRAAARPESRHHLGPHRPRSNRINPTPP